VSGREFIPAAVAAAQTVAAMPTELDEDEPSPEERAAAEHTQQTEAAIAAAAASAPQGLVFLPIKGRTPANFKAIDNRIDDAAFMPIDRTRRQSACQQAASGAALALAAINARSSNAAAGAAGGAGKQLDPLLEATKPQQDTGLMPAADPFAAARKIMEDGGAVAVPAWFDKAMMDATSKYQAMQSVGGR
jgi:hypothetical protein